ncbi:MAG TPA: serine/threonine-protein kinase [Candidatus Obscuribacterales bacterium]
MHAQHSLLSSAHGMQAGMPILPNLRSISLLGQGGMSSVYLAEDTALKRHVAVKTMLAPGRMNAEALQRFHREAKCLARLKHPNIADVFSCGVADDGSPYIVMQYVEGRSIAEILEHERMIDARRAVGWFIQIAEALAHAHSCKIVHRDLKPANILVTNNWHGDEHIYVVDFGIAKDLGGDSPDTKLTNTGHIVGSPKYMSPEQCRGGRIDHRSDIYSLGCLMYECLAGRAPFRAKSAYEVIAMHLYDEPAPLNNGASTGSVGRKLESLILRCLAKSPDERPQLMHEVVENLKAYLRNESQIDVEFLDCKPSPQSIIAVLPWNGDPVLLDSSNSPAFDIGGSTANESRSEADRLHEAAMLALSDGVVPMSKSLLYQYKRGELVADEIDERSEYRDALRFAEASADILLASYNMPLRSEEIYRRMMQLTPGDFAESSPARCKLWLKLADALFYQRTKYGDAQTLFAAFIYRWEKSGFPADRRLALYQSHLVDCCIAEESFKQAYEQCKKAAIMWHEWQDDINLAICSLREEYIRLQRSKKGNSRPKVQNALDVLSSLSGAQSKLYAQALRFGSAVCASAGQTLQAEQLLLQSQTLSAGTKTSAVLAS